MSDTRLIAIPAPQLAEAWPRVSHLFDVMAATCGGRQAVRDLVGLVVSGHAQLWASATDQEIIGTALTEIQSYPRQKDAHLFAAGGIGAKECISLIPHFEDWARDQGCAVLKVSGRDGWDRLLKPRGFERARVILEKHL